MKNTNSVLFDVFIRCAICMTLLLTLKQVNTNSVLFDVLFDVLLAWRYSSPWSRWILILYYLMCYSMCYLHDVTPHLEAGED